MALVRHLVKPCRCVKYSKCLCLLRLILLLDYLQRDAAVEIKAIAAYQSPFGGGRHCVRDIIEQTMRVQGKWFNPETYDGE